MRHAVRVLCIAAMGLVPVALAMAWPVDDTYAPYGPPACDRCVPGISPALSSSYWVVGATALCQHPERPCAKVRVNGRLTNLGSVLMRVNGEPMVPITGAGEFGMLASRSVLDGREMTITNGAQTVTMFLGSRTAVINEKRVTLPVGLQWQRGKVYMPIGAIVKKLGWTFVCSPAAGTVDITTR